MSLRDRVHRGYVQGRRVRVLAEHIAELLPPRARVLDVGCGDGTLTAALALRRPDLSLHGIDVHVREVSLVPVRLFDGKQIPFDEGAFDALLFVDSLHHAEDPLLLLTEAVRVSRQAVVIKDHTLDGFMAGPTLRLMDRVGNARHGVPLPFNYWTEARWRESFAQLGLHIEVWRAKLGLYPPPAGWLFDRSLHFLARLVPAAAGPGTLRR